MIAQTPKANARLVCLPAAPESAPDIHAGAKANLALLVGYRR